MHKQLLPYLSMLALTGVKLPSGNRQQIPIDINHPVIRKGLVTLKYRVQNRIKNWSKFNKREPNNEELIKIINDTVTSVGKDMPKKEFCEAFYSIVNKVMHKPQEEEKETSDESTSE